MRNFMPNNPWIKTLNIASVEAWASIVPMRPLLYVSEKVSCLIDALKKCDNTELAKKVRQEIFDSYDKPMIEAAVKDILFEAQYLQQLQNPAQLKAEIESDLLSRNPITRPDHLAFKLKLEEALQNPKEWFETEIYLITTHHIKEKIQDLCEKIQYLITEYQPEEYSLKDCNPQIVEQIQKLVGKIPHEYYQLSDKLLVLPLDAVALINLFTESEDLFLDNPVAESHEVQVLAAELQQQP